MRYLANIMMVLFLGLGVQNSLLAAERIYTPKLGTPERKAINDALRGAVEKELKKPVIFRIDVLNVMNGWAFLRGIPLEKSGKRMDYRGTPYQELIDAGMFDDWICALLNKEGNGTRWRVVVYALGATDVPFIGWVERYHAPPGIFK
jgi:hypothetical protein